MRRIEISCMKTGKRVHLNISCDEEYARILLDRIEADARRVSGPSDCSPATRSGVGTIAQDCGQAAGSPDGAKRSPGNDKDHS